MTNFNHFAKPVVHFGNSHEEQPEVEAETNRPFIHFGSQS